MSLDQISNCGPLALESGMLPSAPCSPGLFQYKYELRS